MNSDDNDYDIVLQCLYEKFTLLEVVMEGDLENVQSILDDNPTVDELNERDRTGKVHMYSYYYLRNDCNIFSVYEEIT